MAGGQLVPHQLPDGRTVMVPDYLLPAQPALALPNAGPRPPQGPLLAFNGPGGPGFDVPPELPPGIPSQFGARRPTGHAEPPASAYVEPPAAAGPSPAEVAAREQAAANQPSPDEEAKRRVSGAYAREQDRKQAERAAKPGAVDPSTLATGRPQQQQPEQDPNGGMDPLVRQVFNEGPRGGGGGRSPGMVPGSIKIEREPGKELVPELKWAYGLEQRPDFGEEVDPDAEQPTWGNADPVMRKVLTPGERAAEKEGVTARQEFERQELARQEMAIAQKAALAEQSNAIDAHLGEIAERRRRVAELHDTADRRMAEAESMEPRTRGEIWESKGNLARGTAILAAVLSGAAAGLQGRGGSPAWEQIERSIDDDVAADRYKAERRMKLGLEAKSDFERAVTLYGDLDIAALEAKQRKSANMLAITQQMLADRMLDESARVRGQQAYEAGKAAFMQRQQQLYEMLTGKGLKEEIIYKPGPTGGGQGLDTLARLERAARAKKAVNTISGEDNKPRVNPHEQAELNAAEADLAPLKELLNKYRNEAEIPGIAGHNVASRVARGVADFVGGEGSGSSALDTEEERANRIVVNRARLAYKHAVTGAGGSDKEASQIDEAFAGARTKHDLAVAARLAEQVLATRRKLSAGGPSTLTPSQRAASEEPFQ